MSLWRKFIDYTKKSNAKALGRYDAHDQEVSDGCCCHCNNCHYMGTTPGKEYHCSKNDVYLDEKMIKTHGCSSFSAKQIDWWKL